MYQTDCVINLPFVLYYTESVLYTSNKAYATCGMVHNWYGPQQTG